MKAAPHESGATFQQYAQSVLLGVPVDHVVCNPFTSDRSRHAKTPVTYGLLRAMPSEYQCRRLRSLSSVSDESEEIESERLLSESGASGLLCTNVRLD